METTPQYENSYLKFRFIFSIGEVTSFLLTLTLFILSFIYLICNENINRIYVMVLFLTFGNIYSIFIFICFGHTFHDYLLKENSTINDIVNMSKIVNIITNTLNEISYFVNFGIVFSSYLVFFIIVPINDIMNDKILFGYFIVICVFVTLFSIFLTYYVICFSKLKKIFIKEHKEILNA